MTKQNYDYGDPNWKSKHISWRNPQIWTAQGYKFWMYQSENGFLNWRILKATRPDGSSFDTMSYGFKANIGSNITLVKKYLKDQIKYDLLSESEKQKLQEESNNRPIF